MTLSGPIPANILSKMDPKDRPKGVAGMLPSEVHTAAVVKAEKALQKEVANYLRFLRIPFINPPMNRKSTLPLGWPDFTFAYKGVPVTWECKAISGSLDVNQMLMAKSLESQGWQWRLIRNLSEAVEHLREIDSLSVAVFDADLKGSRA